MTHHAVSGRAIAGVGASRRSYTASELTRESLADTWLAQLHAWYDEAVDDDRIIEANAMQVATVDEEGRPDVRTVLARGFDSSGVVFFTNYSSTKGRQLRSNSRAAAVFSWLALERQVRFRGSVSKVSRAETEAYFGSRPRGAQLAAWASAQSEVIAERAVLDERLMEFAIRFEGLDIPVPEYWGGYRIEVAEMEFWQGREFRLHDRLRYRPSGESDRWVVERLAP